MTELKVVPLRRAKGTDDVAATLRRIADDIEAGTYSDWPITTAVLVCGHESEKPDGEGAAIKCDWQTHGMGPRNGVLACRGLLASSLRRFEGD